MTLRLAASLGWKIKKHVPAWDKKKHTLVQLPGSDLGCGRRIQPGSIIWWLRLRWCGLRWDPPPTRLFPGCINCDVAIDSDLRACREHPGWHTRPAFVHVRSESLHLRGKPYREACRLWGRRRHWYNDALHGIQKQLFLGSVFIKQPFQTCLGLVDGVLLKNKDLLLIFKLSTEKEVLIGTENHLLLHSNLTATRCFCNCALNGHQRSWLSKRVSIGSSLSLTEPHNWLLEAFSSTFKEWGG